MTDIRFDSDRYERIMAWVCRRYGDGWLTRMGGDEGLTVVGRIEELAFDRYMSDFYSKEPVFKIPGFSAVGVKTTTEK